MQLSTEGRGRAEKEQGGVTIDLRLRANIVARGAGAGSIRWLAVCASVHSVSPNSPNMQLQRTVPVPKKSTPRKADSKINSLMGVEIGASMDCRRGYSH